MTDRWSAIERIFHAALERPAAARGEFLAEACGKDEGLRREVEGLLNQGSLTGFLEQPAVQVAAALVGVDAGAPLTGQQIGVYSVTGLLGRGGMGEVYRARDTRLGREVALKVLPRALISSPDRRARFEREARVLASLSHPHIGMLYGIEESGGSLALILELVEGETLAERLARGPVPLKQALTWARQIADALDEAHQKGIVHRDLKPANIKISTAQDAVKVLDFGLARSFSHGPDLDELGRTPTITQGATIIGTAAYMSPEQARGEPVDKRSDVWAFGCVFYELLTGKMAFAERTVTDTLAAVLHREPDWTAIPPSTPPSIVTLLRRCLDKDQRRRRRDIGDARAEIDDAIAAPSQFMAQSDVRPLRVGAAQRPRRTAMLALGILSAAAVGGLAAWWAATQVKPETRSPEARFKRITDAVGIEEMPAVSPDGKDVAFVARVDGYRQIWIRRLTGGQPLQITRDPVDHENPRWTPDSSAIVYFTPGATEDDEGTLSEIPAVNGMPRRLATAATGADVSHDGRWLATMQRSKNGMVLTLLARDGATAAEHVAGEVESWYDASAPRWSFDDRMVAFTTGQGALGSEVVVFDVATRTGKAMHRATNIGGFAWLPDGKGIVIASSRGATVTYPPIFSLHAVSLDGTRERQLTFGDVSYEQPDVDKAGQLFAVRTFMKSDIWRFPVAGSPEENVSNAVEITRQTAQVRTPSVSPDGTEIAYLSDSGGHSNIWTVKVDGSENPRPLTAETDDRVLIGIPVWSPVDDRIVFIRDDGSSPRGGNLSEWLIRRDGSGKRALAKGSSAAWSADGKSVYFQNGDTRSCIYKVQIDDDAAPVRVRCDAAVPAPAKDGTLYFVPHAFQSANEIYKAKPENSEKRELVAKYPRSRVPYWPTGFAVSPDDRWLAVPLTDHGTANIWAIPTSGGPFRQITDFGRRPTLVTRQVSWSRDGVFIFAAVTEVDSDVGLLAGMVLDTGS